MARVPGLKNYVQIVPGEYLPAVYALSKNDRDVAVKNLLSTWGIADDEYRKVGGKILESLDGKEKTLVQLKKSLLPVSREVSRKRREKAMNVSVVAQAMQDRWILLRGGIGRRPGENPGRFSIFKNRFKMKLDVGREEALSLLARRYVKSYGPVSVGDLAWWLGVTLDQASRALEGIEDAIGVEVEGVGRRFYIDKKDEVRMAPGEPPIVFLPKDDPYVKAYYNEARFVPPGRQIMTKFGESASVILIDGVAWGTWRLEKERPTGVCRVSLFEGHPPVDGEKLGAAAEEAGRFYTGGSVEVKVSLKGGDT
jgi:DNA-binding transcriptional ArsR family regulator